MPDIDAPKTHWTINKDVRIGEILAVSLAIGTLAAGWASVREQISTMQVRQEMFERQSERQSVEMKNDLGKLIIDLRTELRDFRSEVKADMRNRRD